MNGPVIMVLTSSICVVLFCVIGLIYQFIYPKKVISPLLLVILISLLPLVSILRPGSYESGDLSRHAMVGMSFFQSLIERDFHPIWSRDLNATYGYPLFMFTYLLPYYAISFFHVLGFGFLNSTKLVLAFSFTLSGVGVFFWLKEELKKDIAALTGTLFYLFAPYHLIDLHFRADIGEIIAFTCIPFVLLAIKRTFNSPSLDWIFTGSLSLALLVLSHQATSLMHIPFFICYALFFVHY